LRVLPGASKARRASSRRSAALRRVNTGAGFPSGRTANESCSGANLLGARRSWLVRATPDSDLPTHEPSSHLDWSPLIDSGRRAEAVPDRGDVVLSHAAGPQVALGAAVTLGQIGECLQHRLRFGKLHPFQS